jgi:RecG-like helicase
MKKSLALVAGMAVLLAALVSVRTFAADENVTITGEGKCAKCALKEAKECQNVIQTQKDGRTVNYYLVANDVSKEFHGKLCKESKKVTASGTVKEVDGKLQLTPTKIELAAQ